MTLPHLMLRLPKTISRIKSINGLPRGLIGGSVRELLLIGRVNQKQGKPILGQFYSIIPFSTFFYLFSRKKIQGKPKTEKEFTIIQRMINPRQNYT
jgi:hypothetical protein